MFEYKPNITTTFSCLHCHSDNTKVSDTQFLGMHTLATCHCNVCCADFYSTYPIGHAARFPVAFDKKGKIISFSKKAETWFAAPLIASFVEPKIVDATIEKKRFFEAKTVVILNCLDDCYGHVFLKLLNAQRHMNQHHSLIVIIPKSFAWLLPNGIAEVWLVDAPLNKLNHWIKTFDQFVTQELERFKQVYFSKAYTHLDHTKIDLKKFVKMNRFDLSQYGQLKPTITFVLREDKFWLNSRFDDFLYKASVKFKKLPHLKNYFSWKQNRTVNKLVKRIKNERPEVNFMAVGLGKTGNLMKIISDKN